MERLDKLVSIRRGISRRDAKALIKSGGAEVNGVPVFLPEHKCGEADVISVNGQLLDSEKYLYCMMNKPAGVLCATRDKNTATVLDLLPEDMRRKGLFPAGRLDKDAEGFVLITDDGDFAHRILSPKNHVPKRYYVVVDGFIPDDLPELFARGLDLGGGDAASPSQLRVIKSGAESEAELVIYEGMFHQVKRMFSKFSLKVVYLKRICIGGLELDDALAPGESRRISRAEVAKISDIFGDIL